ncbi:MAG TPA: M6 family metalloprotease domain-containing protein [Ignavibacteriales bacterium]|nr:M6 family metalloprotease domain-containing protein [Ignavibacteriales bacterium]
MKKLLIFLCLSFYIFAVPAKPGIIEIKNQYQNLKVYLTGDEKLSYITTLDGYTLLYDNNGILKYATLDEDKNLVPSNIIANEIYQRTDEEKVFLNSIQPYLSYSPQQVNLKKQLFKIQDVKIKKSFPSKGNHKLLMILIDFPDIKAKISKTAFENLMNQNKYGGIGSFKDYYLSQSFGQLNITTDVYGWYTAKYNHDYYGKEENGSHDSQPYALAREAVDAAYNDGVNFANYDNDKDGNLDAVMIIHAGYGQEAGAPSTTIWSHRWSLSAGGLAVTYNGVYINDYAIQPELANASGSNITNIGVIVHEFGHILGLPDWYDTDYATNGQAFDLGQWDVMAGGSWNNNGKTPTNHNSFSRWWLGWIEPVELKEPGTYTLKSMSKYHEFYIVRTPVKGEFFMLENRQKELFDSVLPGKGMLIYHVDSNYIAQNWNSNTINTIPEHQGLDIEEADNDRSNGSYAGDPFPGTTNNTSFTDYTTPNSLTWNNNFTSKPITNIKEDNLTKTITFDFLGAGKPLFMFTNILDKQQLKPNSQYDLQFLCYSLANFNLYIKNLKNNNILKIASNVSTNTGNYNVTIPDLPFGTYLFIATPVDDTTNQFYSKTFIIYEVPKIYITEVVDNNNFDADYVEIYNAGTKSVSLNNFTLEERYLSKDNTNRRYINFLKNTQKNPNADLILEPGEYALIVNYKMTIPIDSFIKVYGIPSNIAIFNNKLLAPPQIDGDERYQLIDSLGNIIDKFGRWDNILNSHFRTKANKCYARNTNYENGELATSWIEFDNTQYNYTPGKDNILTSTEYYINDKFVVENKDLVNIYPNPFNPTTTIKFTLKNNSFVNIKIFNILGEQVCEILNKEFQSGIHTIQFNASNLNSGVYFCTIKTNSYVKTLKLSLIK